VWTQFAAFTTKPAGLQQLREYSFADLCVGQLCGTPAVPQLVVFALVAMAITAWIYGHTRLGRELLMTGANPKAAELSGIPTRARIITAHLMSGTLAGLAGFLLAVSTGSFKASIGADFLLPSFLGPILGGTLLAGGVVSVLGTALGTAVTLIIRQGLDLMGVGLGSLNIYLGIVLLVALSFDRVRGMITGPQRR
jgi:ribose transport system permease protein